MHKHINVCICQRPRGFVRSKYRKTRANGRQDDRYCIVVTYCYYFDTGPRCRRLSSWGRGGRERERTKNDITAVATFTRTRARASDHSSKKNASRAQYTRSFPHNTRAFATPRAYGWNTRAQRERAARGGTSYEPRDRTP